MIAASRFVSDAQEDFQGGTALSVNFDSALRRAAQKLIKEINLDTLKVRQAVYGGITSDQEVHFYPTEVARPTALYKNDNIRKWTYQPPSFFLEKRQDNAFTVISINGKKFLQVRSPEAGGLVAVDDMDTLTGLTGTATVAINNNDFFTGDAALQATFNDTGLTLTRAFDEAQDVTDYLRGVEVFAARISDASKVASIEIRLQTTVSDYYKLLSTADDINDNLVNGWNWIRFAFENRTSVGSPVATNIVSWLVKVTATTGDTVTLVMDRLTLQKSAPLWLDGYSNKIFVDATTGEAKSDVDTTVDSVNIDEDVADILHYEFCLMILSASDVDKTGNQASAFANQLKRAYASYYENHPSEEIPLSYNVGPELNRRTEPYAYGYSDDVLDTTVLS